MFKETLNKVNNEIPLLIDKTIKFLDDVRKKYYTKDEEIKYTSLSPIDTKDNSCEYTKALKWALDNRKEQDIKNIALTGSYGAGKSTILKTLQSNYASKKIKFLPISLATFKEEKPILDDQGKIIPVDKSELIKCIETSILEQIFYKEKDSKIPDSRFKKIKSYSLKNIIIYSIGYLFFVLAAFNYFNPSFIQSVFKDFPFSSLICDVIHYGTFLILVIGLFIIISKSIRIISAITINKLKIQNAEIGIGDNLNKSILNHHIDELLYFFSQTKYNVVIIEDLDRFEETEIFTKLREINLILSNSEKTKELHIVFIYAVRDNIFIDKERAKFFDFIVPVIPYINPSNSSEKLLGLANKNDFKLSDNLIEDISFYIDDMRLLNNISNEFYLYSTKIVEITNHDKLFALITYKNIYPSDFMELSNNKSILNTIFDQRIDYIKSINDIIDLKIEKIREQIKDYNNLYITDVKDLRRIYLIKLIENLIHFDSFIINDSTKKIDEVIEDDIFPYIISNEYAYNKITNQYYGNNVTLTSCNTNVDFSKIEGLVDSSKNYVIKEKELKDLNNGVINSLKRQIQELEKEKQENRKLQLSELIKSDKISDISVDDKFDKNFIITLLRNGYIAEDYLDYITLFHGESITRDDYQFLINIKNRVNLPFEFKLHKIEKLISKINPLDFQTEYILNYNLIDYFLNHLDKYNQNIFDVFGKLKDESKISINFIKGFLEVTQNQEVFIKLLCNNWSNIFNYIVNDTDSTDELKNEIFKYIIEFADIVAINEIALRSKLKQIILDNPDFLTISNNHNKLKEVIKALKIKFIEIDLDNSPHELQKFVYENSYYQLNINMISSIIKNFGEFKQVEFDNSNYEAIKSSNVSHLIEYIEENINEYIENVYLKISTNSNEKENYLISMLNNVKITAKNKESILQFTKTKIEKLDIITDTELYPILLQNNKVKASWENLLYAFNNQEVSNDDEDDGTEIELDIPSSIIDFINIKENAEDLSKIKIPKIVDGKKIYSKFWKMLLNKNAIDDQSYNLITKSSPWWYSDLNFGEISGVKIEMLIKNTCLNPVIETFISLKENYVGLHIYLFEKRKVEYFKILDELDFDSDDLELILKSNNFTNYEKQKLLKRCSSETIITDNILKVLSTIIINDNTFYLDEIVLKTLLNNRNIPVMERIKIFNKNYSKFDNSSIEIFLENLGSHYAEIPNKSKKAKIPFNEDNKNLLYILKNKHYISSITPRSTFYSVNHFRN